MDAPLRGFSLTSFRSLVYPRPCEDLLPYLRFAWPLSLGNKVNQPVFRYDPPRTHTRNNTYTKPTDTCTLTYIHGPAHACSFIDFAGVKGESGRQWIQRPYGRIETGQKRALVEAGRETEDFCLRSLITVLTYADENARMIGGLTGKGKKIIEKLIFSIPFDQWAKHQCVASSCVCSAAFGANTCDWLSSKGEIR